MSATVRLSGPLFQGIAGSVIQRAAEDVVREVTEKGMERLTSAFPTGVPARSGNLRRNIHPTINGMQAQIDSGGVIYANWIEGTSSRNETTRFKGYSTYRKASQYLQDEVVPKSIEKHAPKLVKELGG